MKITMNETRKSILKALQEHKSDEGLTLNEIAKIIGVDKINTGTTNTLVNAGLIEVAGQTEIEVVAKRKVNTYKIGSKTLEQLEKEGQK